MPNLKVLKGVKLAQDTLSGDLYFIDCSGSPVRLTGMFDSLGYPTYIRKLQDYFYEAAYKTIDYTYAQAYFKSRGSVLPAGCSAVRKDNLVGRNLDWNYSNLCDFVVTTPHTSETRLVVGTAGGLKGLIEASVAAHEPSMLYRVLPFCLQDGVNEDGLFACCNVVPTDYGYNVAEPTGVQEEDLSGIMLVRYILDHFSNASDAVEYIQEHCRVYFPTSLHAYKYELHILVVDAAKAYVLEFVDNATQIIDVTDSPYITNFHRYGTTLNSDGTVFTPDTQSEQANAYDTNGITLHGSGLERFNLIVGNYESIESISSMRAVLNQLLSSRMYSTHPDTANPAWLTEFVDGDLTVKSAPEAFEQICELAGEAYAHRDRANPKTWHTTHSAIYDIDSKKLYIRAQELPVDYIFELEAKEE